MKNTWERLKKVASIILICICVYYSINIISSLGHQSISEAISESTSDAIFFLKVIIFYGKVIIFLTGLYFIIRKIVEWHLNSKKPTETTISDLQYEDRFRVNKYILFLSIEKGRRGELVDEMQSFGKRDKIAHLDFRREDLIRAMNSLLKIIDGIEKEQGES